MEHNPTTFSLRGILDFREGKWAYVTWPGLRQKVPTFPLPVPLWGRSDWEPSILLASASISEDHVHCQATAACYPEISGPAASLGTPQTVYSSSQHSCGEGPFLKSLFLLFVPEICVLTLSLLFKAKKLPARCLIVFQEDSHWCS